MTIGGRVVARSSETIRLDKAGAQSVFYFPLRHVDLQSLVPSPLVMICDMLGLSLHYNLVRGPITLSNIAWTVPCPSSGLAELRNRIAFDPERIERLLIAPAEPRPAPTHP